RIVDREILVEDIVYAEIQLEVLVDFVTDIEIDDGEAGIERRRATHVRIGGVVSLKAAHPPGEVPKACGVCRAQAIGRPVAFGQALARDAVQRIEIFEGTGQLQIVQSLPASRKL